MSGEERQLDQEAQQARALLEDEIISNYAILADFRLDVVDRYQRLRGLGDLLEDDVAFDHYATCFVGYRFAQFRDAAWQRASRDRIGSRIDARYMDVTAGLYSWNEVLDSLAEPINHLIYSIAYFDPAHNHASWRLAERVVWQQQRWADVMLDEYEEFFREFAQGRIDEAQDTLTKATARWEERVESRTQSIQEKAPRCTSEAAIRADD